mmetsp:Transcript_19768/g.63577  ORF Transcript_19768/g.63577 Transcript_19768/m.63577 type:complete len:202 (-) Transcript_19768:1747-2352(-)
MAPGSPAVGGPPGGAGPLRQRRGDRRGQGRQRPRPGGRHRRFCQSTASAVEDARRRRNHHTTSRLATGRPRQDRGQGQRLRHQGNPRVWPRQAAAQRRGRRRRVARRRRRAIRSGLAESQRLARGPGGPAPPGQAPAGRQPLRDPRPRTLRLRRPHPATTPRPTPRRLRLCPGQRPTPSQGRTLRHPRPHPRSQPPRNELN